MKRVVITGSTGLVGSRIVEILGKQFELIPLTQALCDITKPDSVHEALEHTEYDLLLHLAAYTNVDQAENNKELAYGINVTGTRNLFTETQRKSKPFIYISTDFVFDGKEQFYNEDSAPHPLGYYGQTKHEGELIVKNKGMIVRISYPYRAPYGGKPDFVQRIRALLTKKVPLAMVTDSIFTPTYIDDIAHGLAYLCNHYSPSLFHLVGSSSLSPYEAGKLIAQKYGLDASPITQTTYDEYFTGKALRPKMSKIVSNKIAFIPMHSFEDGLKAI
ncbi:MAG: sugar nucleotide-binding protein [Patescibacteria group bacterium]|jgi:dTDP-4-dehydrorhamnose reductase